MNRGKLFAIVAMASAFGMFGCNKPEGVYALDKEAMKKAVQAEPAEGPEAARELLLALLDELEAQMELEPGGALTMSAKMGGKEEEPRKGTWKEEGGAIVLQLNDERITCNKDGAKKLTCGSQDDKQKMVFVKTTSK